MILAIINSNELTGVVINNFKLPCSDSRTIATLVNSTIVMVKITPNSPGTILIAERWAGLYTRDH
jgi:hypothetical protein